MKLSEDTKRKRCSRRKRNNEEGRTYTVEVPDPLSLIPGPSGTLSK